MYTREDRLCRLDQPLRSHAWYHSLHSTRETIQHSSPRPPVDAGLSHLERVLLLGASTCAGVECAWTCLSLPELAAQVSARCAHHPSVFESAPVSAVAGAHPCAGRPASHLTAFLFGPVDCPVLAGLLCAWTCQAQNLCQMMQQLM